MELRREGDTLEIKVDSAAEAKLLFDVVDGALMANYYWQDASTELSAAEEDEITWENVLLHNLLEQLAEIRKEMKKRGEE